MVGTPSIQLLNRKQFIRKDVIGTDFTQHKKNIISSFNVV
jgi:hypothetical protein